MKTQAPNEFVTAPVGASALLQPIGSWDEMYRETLVTGVEFDSSWYETVANGVVFFFRWVGEPRSTVLVVYGDGEILHVEARQCGDIEVSPADLALIAEEVHRVFTQVPPDIATH